MVHQQTLKRLYPALLKKTTAIVSSLSLTLMPAVQAAAETIYAINADNSGLISFDTSNASTETVKSLSFFTQGQVTYNPLLNNVYLFDSNNKKIIKYDLDDSSSADISISNNADQVQSVFGYKIDGTLIAKTDDFGEAASTAKRFAEIELDGTLTRIGEALVNGSEYPQGDAHYSQNSNSIYTISNNSSAKFSVLDLNLSTASAFASTSTTVDGFGSDENILFAKDTTSDTHQILKIDVANQTSSVFVSAPPDGYDAFAQAFVDAKSNELTVVLGKAGGSAIATYDLENGSLKKLTDTSAIEDVSRVGRFVNTSLVIDVTNGEEVLIQDIESSIVSIAKTGEGTLTVSGTNNSTNGVDIEAGTLKVASSVNLGSGAVSLEGGELELSANATVTNNISSSNDSSAIDTGTNTVAVSGTLSGSNAITKKGSGTLEITGTNNLTGAAKVQEGTLKVASADKLGSSAVSLEGGELELSANATVTNNISSSNDSSAIDTGEQSVTVSGDLSGTGEINKVGDGTLTLTGSLNNSGGVDIMAGTVVANGTGTTPVTVTSGVLQGSGTIGNLTSNSTIEPGNSIGTLNVSGAVTLGANSVLVIEIDAAGNNDKIIATGAVTTGWHTKSESCFRNLFHWAAVHYHHWLKRIWNFFKHYCFIMFRKRLCCLRGYISYYYILWL
jgi:autotransporter-associated beta strand protein